jgi:acetylornithine deacetylase/succinyl-diaminopimelate desuccinylase-like protein
MSKTATQSEALLQWLRRREDEMSAMLEELVSVPTENPPGKNYRLCVEVLESHLRRAGLTCERSVYEQSSESGDAPACLFARYGSGNRALYFHGHYDVVPSAV